MADGILSATLLKAVDELSHKFYIPVTVVAVFVDYLDQIKLETGFENFWLLYFCCFIIGGIISFMSVGFILAFEDLIHWKLGLKGIDLKKCIGVFLLPLGFMSIFPEFFKINEVSLPAATGIACSVWGLMFLGDKKLA